MFKKLLIGQRSARLSAKLYKGLVSVKDRGFRDQLTRVGLSIASNMAEGYGRGGVLEVRQFLRYAKGSAAEVATQIYIGMDIGYIDKTQGKAWAQEAQEVQSILAALIRKDRPPARLALPTTHYPLHETALWRVPQSLLSLLSIEPGVSSS